MRTSLPRPGLALGLIAVVALLVATPAAGRSDGVRANVSYLDNGTVPPRRTTRIGTFASASAFIAPVCFACLDVSGPYLVS